MADEDNSKKTDDNTTNSEDDNLKNPATASPTQSTEDIDSRIKSQIDIKLKAREDSLELREMKLKEQTQTVQKMLDEVQQGGRSNVNQETNPKDKQKDRINGMLAGTGQKLD